MYGEPEDKWGGMDVKKLDEEQILKRYLLGDLSEEEVEQIELSLLLDHKNLEELIIIEETLIDEYLEGALSKHERIKFEGHFLAAPENRKELLLAKTLRNCIANVATDGVPKNSIRSNSKKALSSWIQSVSAQWRTYFRAVGSRT